MKPMDFEFFSAIFQTNPLGDLVMQYKHAIVSHASELCNHVLQDLALSKSENTPFYGHFAATGNIS
jgi:hypothetical protein